MQLFAWAILLTGVVGMVWAAAFRWFDRQTGTRDAYVPCAGGWHESVLAGCERGLEAVPQQPVNTWSNLAYAFAGFYAILAGGAVGIAVGVGLLYLGTGSALYHGLSNRWAGALDVSGMYAVFGMLALAPWLALVGFAGPLLGILLLIAGIAAGYLLRYKWHGHLEFRMGLGLVIGWAGLGLGFGALLEDPRWLVIGGSVLCFAGAMLAWRMDKAGRFWWAGRGHGVWHGLTAAAIGLHLIALGGGG